MTDLTAPPEPTMGVLWTVPDGSEYRFLVAPAVFAGAACILCGQVRSDLEDVGTLKSEQGTGPARVCPGNGCEVAAA